MKMQWRRGLLFLAAIACGGGALFALERGGGRLPVDRIEISSISPGSAVAGEPFLSEAGNPPRGADGLPAQPVQRLREVAAVRAEYVLLHQSATRISFYATRAPASTPATGDRRDR